MFNTALKTALFATAVSIAAPASAQSIQQGTYVNENDSAKWIFGASTGSFVQYKSINGNPGSIIIEFTYTLSSNGKVLNYRQTRISLVDHPDARSQNLDKASSEAIEIRPNAIVIGGNIYTRQ